MKDLRTILRCTGVALVVIAALALAPATAQAGITLHGAEILKGCTSPQSNCNSDDDCDDGVFCNGAETCSTPSASEPTTNCIIQVTNTDDFNDDLSLESAIDRVFPGAPEEQAFNVAISAVVDNAPAGDTTCAVGVVLGTSGDAVSCVIGNGDVVRWTSNGYLIQPGDTAIPDQATVQFTDLCNGTPSGDCNPGTLNTLQANATTNVTNNCQPGNNPCPETPDLCDTITCNEDTDQCDTVLVVCVDNFCEDFECDPTSGLCEVVSETDCDDQNECTTDVCDVSLGACVNTDVVTPTCDENCEECDTTTGLCVPLDPLPEICLPGDEICRTPGFWGTHGGTEKANSQNITLAVLNAFNNNNDPDLEICGQTINNTTLGSVNSALEAICASPKGDSRIQLARQLTAAALNCIISSAVGDDAASCGASLGDGDVCGGVSIGAVFDACNAACEAGDVTADVDLDGDPLTDPVEVSCIGAIDCFNNGGVINEETGECEEAIGETCHERDLETDCFDFQPPGPAGSPRECNDSRKNDVIVVPPAP